MECYRYQVKSQADYEKVAAWLMENGISFTSQFSPLDCSGKRRYYITADLTNCGDETTLPLGDFLDRETDLMCADFMPGFYHTPEDAYDDPYSDPHSLRTMLGVTLGHIRRLTESHVAECEAWKKDVDAAKKSEKIYFDLYGKQLANKKRVREQIQAIALLLDSIFPKED
ncbi:MAG: hypothetical protein NC411_00190 [Bacteroides sp.]|nr:hypothetical protein [Bacteroides sp.]